MKFKTIAGLAMAACLFAPAGLQAQPTNAVNTTAVDAVQIQLQQLVHQIQDKANAGQRTEADYADEIKAFDTLLASEKGAKTDEAALIASLKAQLYLQVFKDYDKTVKMLGEVATNYPNTQQGKHAAEILPDLERMAAAQKIQDGLAVGSIFPDFTETNLNGGKLSVHSFKGKVVLLDFWATWCPPCRAELPDVIALYRKYHGEGFEVIGVSLDSDRDALDAFLKQQEGMTWPQYFDGQRWTNRLAVKYGVTGIPFTLLIGPNGKIIANGLHGEALEDAVAEAMAMK